MIPVFENDFVVSNYNTSENQLEIKWKAYSESLDDENFKNILLEFAAFVEKNTVQSIFVDASEKYYVMNSNIQKWHDETIIPRYLKAGIKNMAFHIDNNISVDIAIDLTFDEENAKKIPTQLFESRDEAKTWLIQQTKAA